jgi:hypothetical protein
MDNQMYVRAPANRKGTRQEKRLAFFLSFFLLWQNNANNVYLIYQLPPIV